jgi:hypothetical protein
MSAIDPAQVLRELNDFAGELDTVSKELMSVEELLLVATVEYEEFMASYEEGLWEQHVNSDAKFPPQQLRERMAHRAMKPDVLGQYIALTARRRRIQQRISSLKSTVEAKRSVVVALREEGLAVGTTGGR